MPELPEVETIKRGLEKEIVGTRIVDVVFLWNKTLKNKNPKIAATKIVGKKIISIKRRAKIIIINLEGGLNLLFHMKMTGHLIIAPASTKIKNNGQWVSNQEELKDPFNQYIRLIVYLNNNKLIAFSDLRKFGYLKIISNTELEKILSEYGPEPFSKDFNVNYLKKILSNKKIAIKKALLDQKTISGIGNIYADEILFASKINPLKTASKVSEKELNSIIQNTKKILRKSIELGGTSTSDFRNIKGDRGLYGNRLKVYKKNGRSCTICHSEIKRMVVGGRGTHFCPKCQELND